MSNSIQCRFIFQRRRVRKACKKEKSKAPPVVEPTELEEYVHKREKTFVDRQRATATTASTNASTTAIVSPHTQPFSSAASVLDDLLLVPGAQLNLHPYAASLDDELSEDHVAWLQLNGIAR
jgi:hypothetical protein